MASIMGTWKARNVTVAPRQSQQILWKNNMSMVSRTISFKLKLMLCHGFTSRPQKDPKGRKGEGGALMDSPERHLQLPLWKLVPLYMRSGFVCAAFRGVFGACFLLLLAGSLAVAVPAAESPGVVSSGLF